MAKKYAVPWDIAFLIVMLSLLLYHGGGTLLDHSLTHPQPFAYQASDAFLHKSIAQDVHDYGNMKKLPYYYSGFDDVINMMPPLFNHVTALLSRLTGLEVYDVMYVLVFVFSLLAIALYYLTISRWNKSIALLSLPLPVFLLTGKYFISATWGQWDFFLGTFFLVGVVWVLEHFDLLKHSWMLLGLFMTGSFMGHTVEAIWGGAFITVYFIAKFLLKQWKIQKAIEVVKAAGLSILLSLYYLPIFILFWIPGRSGKLFKLTPLPERWGHPIPFVTDIHWSILVLAIAGSVLAIFLLKKKWNAGIFFALFMLVMGFTNYMGFDKAMQMRMMWPLHLSVLVGIPLYFLLEGGYGLIKKKSAHTKSKISKNVKVGIAGVIGIILFSVVLISVVEVQSSPGMMHPALWEQLNWLKENTPETADIFYFHGDIYSQNSLFRNSQRRTYYVQTQDFIGTLQNQSVKRFYHTRLSGGTAAGLPYKQEGFLKFGDHQDETRKEGSTYWLAPMDVCNFDYYVFDKFSQQPMLAQYNMYLGSVMVQNLWMEVVFDNQAYTIMKNNKKGEECIVPGKIKTQA
jgi:hypothetical protein